MKKLKRDISIEEEEKYFEKEYFCPSHDIGYSQYKDYGDSPRFDTLADKIADMNPESVLEIGCARGFLVKRLLERGINTFGIDISNWAIENRVSDNVIKGSIIDIPFRNREFDLIFTHDVLEHIPEAYVDLAISEMRRVSKRMYHVISIISYPDDTDITHVTMRPIRWWRKKMPEALLEEKKYHHKKKLKMVFYKIYRILVLSYWRLAYS